MSLHGISQFQITTDGVTGVVYDSLENPKTSLSDPDEWFIDAVGGGKSSAGVRVNRKSSLGYPPFWRGVNLICNGVSKLALHVYRRSERGGGEREKSHPAYRLLRRKPNDYMTAGVFKKLLQAHACVHGNGYAAIFRDGRGQPTELLPLSPTDTYPVIANGQVWYVTTIDGEMLRIRHTDVLHIKGLSLDGLIGLSLIDLMKEALGLGMAARKFGAHFFGQGSHQSGVLMIPGHLKPEAIKNTIEMWNEMAQGLTKAHKVALIQDGVKYQPTTVPPEQAQFLQTRQFEVREVANIIGVPPHMLSDSSRAAYNTLEQENKSYLEHSLDPWLCAWEEECDDKLLSEDEKQAESHYTEFNRKALMRTDSRSRAEFYRKLSEIGVFSINDVLRAESEPTLGPLGDRRYRPGNWVEITEEPAEPPQTPVPNPPPGTDDENETADDETDEDGTGVADAAALREAHREMLRDVARRFAKLEDAEVRKALAKAVANDGRFPKLIEALYGWFAGRLEDAVSPLVRAVRAAAGGGNAAFDTKQFLSDYIGSSIADLNSAEKVERDHLESSVKQTLADWKEADRLWATIAAHFLDEEDHHAAA